MVKELQELIKLQSDMVGKFMVMGMGIELAQRTAQEALHIFVTSPCVKTEHKEAYKE